MFALTVDPKRSKLLHCSSLLECFNLCYMCCLKEDKTVRGNCKTLTMLPLLSKKNVLVNSWQLLCWKLQMLVLFLEPILVIEEKRHLLCINFWQQQLNSLTQKHKQIQVLHGPGMLEHKLIK